MQQPLFSQYIPFRYDSIGAYPDVLSYMNGCRMHDKSLVGIKIMVKCRKNHPVAYKSPVSDYDPSLILKLTVGINENIITDANILSKISIR